MDSNPILTLVFRERHGFDRQQSIEKRSAIAFSIRRKHFANRLKGEDHQSFEIQYGKALMNILYSLFQQ